MPKKVRDIERCIENLDRQIITEIRSEHLRDAERLKERRAEIYLKLLEIQAKS